MNANSGVAWRGDADTCRPGGFYLKKFDKAGGKFFITLLFGSFFFCVYTSLFGRFFIYLNGNECALTLTSISQLDDNWCRS